MFFEPNSTAIVAERQIAVQQLAQARKEGNEEIERLSGLLSVYLCDMMQQASYGKEHPQWPSH